MIRYTQKSRYKIKNNFPIQKLHHHHQLMENAELTNHTLINQYVCIIEINQ